MAITTRDQLIDAMANNSSQIILDKATLSSQVVGQYTSLWNANGRPAAGLWPVAPAVCTNALQGAIAFANPTAPSKSYLSHLFAACSNNVTSLEIHDRIAHMGGLVTNITTTQTVGVDVQTMGVASARIGRVGFGDLQWWYEIYQQGGGTASNATFNVTFDDGSTANLGTTLAVGGTLSGSRIFSLNALKSTAQQARNIRGVNSVTLSASTTVAGNVGVTVTMPRAVLAMPTGNFPEVADWASTGLPVIADNACLSMIVLCGATSTGTIRGGGKISYG